MLEELSQKVILGSENLAELAPTVKLDTRGLVCPYPSFEASKAAASAAEKDVLEIISDDKYTATSSIATVLKKKEYEYAVVENSDGTYTIKARRGIA
jgi:TusA-related sulfurtransferase